MVADELFMPGNTQMTLHLLAGDPTKGLDEQIVTAMSHFHKLLKGLASAELKHLFEPRLIHQGEKLTVRINRRKVSNHIERVFGNTRILLLTEKIIKTALYIQSWRHTAIGCDGIHVAIHKGHPIPFS